MILLDTDLWHDPFFQFLASQSIAIVSCIAAIIAIIISVILYVKQRSKKEITYQVVSDAPVISVRQNLANRVEIKLDGNPVKEVSLAVIKIWNSGNVAVRKDDYYEPITFEFKGRKVISSEVLETVPEYLIDAGIRKTCLKQDQEYIELPPILLNPKPPYSITFSVLLDGEGQTIEERASIIEGELVEFKDDKIYKHRILFVVAAIIVTIAVTFGFVDFVRAIEINAEKRQINKEHPYQQGS